MTIREYRETFDDSDCPVNALDSAGEHRAAADWVYIPNGGLGDTVTYVTMRGGATVVKTVGADLINIWEERRKIREITSLGGAGNDTVVIGTGDFVASSGPRGPTGATGAAGATGPQGPQGTMGTPIILETTIGKTLDNFAGLGAGVKTFTKVIALAADNPGDWYLVGIELVQTAQFTDGGVGTYSVIVGTSGDDNAFIEATDAKAAIPVKPANPGILLFPGALVPDLELRVKITSSVDLNTTTAGALKVRMVMFPGS